MIKKYMFSVKLLYESEVFYGEETCDCFDV